MSNDFSKESHYVGGSEPEPSAPRGPNSRITGLTKQADEILKRLESMRPHHDWPPSLQSVFDGIMIEVSNIRSTIEDIRQENEGKKWKAWTIGGRVIIREGIYKGQSGKLLGMADTAHGQQAQVELGEGFVVEVGPAWLEGV